MTSSDRLMDIAERLTELDPVRTYPQRGASLIAGLVGAHSYRLERPDVVENIFYPHKPVPSSHHLLKYQILPVSFYLYHLYSP